MASETKGRFDPAALLKLGPEAAVDAIVEEACRTLASDIFVLANENHYGIDVRRLGVVERLASLPQEQGLTIVNLIKTNANIDLANRRRPADGRWTHQRRGGDWIDLRVTSLPTMFGEDLAIRVLPRQHEVLPLTGLGFEADQLGVARGMLSSGSGLILVTGPTGSGKTTTLYACLQHLNDGTRKINTLEDPIECTIKGLRQSQVVPRIDLSFADLLRAVLRQSPDVIMVGEVRDPETAETAVRAANSGQLVLATLHAPLAAGAVQSMLALGVHPYFLASSLVGVLAQRLIRVLSPRTRVAYNISHSPETFADVKRYLAPGEGNVIYGPMDQDAESQRGYVGRTAVFEALSVDRDLRERIAAGCKTSELHLAALGKGMLDFRRAGLIKVAKGATSVEELTRVVPNDELQELFT